MKWFTLLWAAGALADTHTPNPDKDGQVLILLDATTWGDHLAKATKMIQKQLPDLMSAFEDKSLTLEVAIDSFGKRTGTCYKDSLDFTTDWTAINNALASPPQYDVISGSDQSDRNTWNAIMHAVSSYKFRGDDYTRRVVMVVTDDIGAFGNAAFKDPYMPPSAPQALPMAKKVREVVQNSRTGIVHVIQASTQESAEHTKREAAVKRYGETGLSDVSVDGNWDEANWDGIKYHLSRLMSKEYQASTSTTTFEPAAAYTFDPVGDTQVWFLFDSSCTDREWYHIEMGAQASIWQLDELYQSFAKTSFTLKVGAATFGRREESCWKVLMDLTDDYTTVRKEMSNPPSTFTESDTAHRSTIQAIMYAAESLFEGVARRIIVVVTDEVGLFGNDDSYTGDVVEGCVEHLTEFFAPSEEQFDKVLQYNRVGLLINTMNSNQEAADREQAVIMEQFKYSGFTDFFVNSEWSYHQWDAVRYHLVRMISKDWVATTSTQAPMDRIRECVSKIQVCEA